MSKHFKNFRDDGARNSGRSEDGFVPIGHIECQARYRYEAPRQGVLATGNTAKIILNPDIIPLESLSELADFSHIWVIYELHLNETWHAQVRPPREKMHKVGVFASRSPHRPNRIGMSCVELEKIEGLTVHIRSHDLLDLTPVLDIKPYIPYSDSFPEAKAGWLDGMQEDLYEISFSDSAKKIAEWIFKKTNLDAVNFAKVQLSYSPADSVRKRITSLSEGKFVISYRTWRLDYQIDSLECKLKILNIRSGYSSQELSIDSDPHKDKDIHRDFLKTSFLN